MYLSSSSVQLLFNELDEEGVSTIDASTIQVRSRMTGFYRSHTCDSYPPPTLKATLWLDFKLGRVAFRGGRSHSRVTFMFQFVR